MIKAFGLNKSKIIFRDLRWEMPFVQKGSRLQILTIAETQNTKMLYKNAM